MDPVPYEIREDDVDEVLSAYEPVGGGAWSDELRTTAREHVMRNVLDVGDVVRSVPEDPSQAGGTGGRHAHAESMRPGDQSQARREMALAAIEDLLIRDGFIDAPDDEERIFPTTGDRTADRDSR